VGGQRHAPAALPPGKILETNCIGGGVGLRVGMDGCGQSRPHPDSIPGIYCKQDYYYFNARRRVDAGQNTRGTPTVNHDSGAGANGEKTTEQQLHNIPNRRPTKQEIWF
jgi:hypothetical protein